MKTMLLLANACGGFLTHYGSKRRHVGFMPWAVDGMLFFVTILDFTHFPDSGPRGLPAYASGNSVRFTLRTLRLLDALVARKNGEVVNDQKRQMNKLTAAIDSGAVDPETMDKKTLQEFFSQFTPQDAKDLNDRRIQDSEVPDEMDPLLLQLIGEQMTYGRNDLSGSCK